MIVNIVKNTSSYFSLSKTVVATYLFCLLIQVFKTVLCPMFHVVFSNYFLNFVIRCDRANSLQLPSTQHLRLKIYCCNWMHFRFVCMKRMWYYLRKGNVLFSCNIFYKLCQTELFSCNFFFCFLHFSCDKRMAFISNAILSCNLHFAKPWVLI